MNRVHSSLGVTPNEMLMGFAPALPMPFGDVCVSGIQTLASDLEIPQCSDPHDFVHHLQEKLLALDDVALSLIKRQFHTNKCALEKRRQQLRSGQPKLSVGDLVLELDETAGSLSAQARGPFRILALRRHSALLETQDTKFKDRRTFERHLSRLCLYFDRHSL